MDHARKDALTVLFLAFTRGFLRLIGDSWVGFFMGKDSRYTYKFWEVYVGYLTYRPRIYIIGDLGRLDGRVGELREAESEARVEEVFSVEDYRHPMQRLRPSVLLPTIITLLWRIPKVNKK